MIMSMFKKILVPVDGSAPSDAAVKLALRLAHDQDANLVFLHVSEVAKIAAMISSTAVCVDPSPALDAELAAGQDALSRAETNARTSAIPAESILVEGASADSIVKTAKRNGADLIVMGSHGRGGIQRALLGSVAEGVLRHSSVPVLVARVH
jgi:nucleotide-binding universal stress UspA family protein